MTGVLAASIGPAEVLVLGIIALYIWALVVCGMKGRWVLFVLGLLFAPVAFVGALMPAKPDSSWASRRA